MVTSASYGAVVLYLLPVLFVLWARATVDRKLSVLALDIPIAVAADFMLVLTFSRFMRLELATFVSRGVWAAVAVVFAASRFLRRPRGGEGARTWPAWPRALGRREIVAILLTVAVAVGLSLLISRPYSIWDRIWHTPLVASLRGQAIPFRNIYSEREVLHYHFTGDVHAAMLQALSFGVIHSSFALSLSHDMCFGLIGATLALVLRGALLRGPISIALCTLLALLSGPLTLGRGPDERHVEGYNFLNFLTMSFRPHDAVAGLFFVGFLGAVLARIHRRGPLPLADTAPALIACTAGLAISDETTIGLLGLALGVTWLFHPDVLHPRRRVGVLVFLGLLAALLLPNLAFAAGLSPGAQRHVIQLVSWRSPGNYTPTLPLSTARGVRVLVFDTLPTVTVWLAGALASFVPARRRRRPIFVLHTVLFCCSLFALTCIDLNGRALESHRFMTGISFFSPLLGLVALVGGRRAAGSTSAASGSWHALASAGRWLALALVALGVTVGAASTVDWIRFVAPRDAHRHRNFLTDEDLYAVDCTRDYGATFGATPRPTYIATSSWYAYAGCNPIFAPAPHYNTGWAITIGSPLFGKDALRALHQRMPRSASLPVVCPLRSADKERDAVCMAAVELGVCQDISQSHTRCELSFAQRAEVLRR